MAAKGPSLAKLTPPSLPRVLDRPRLFREIDRARRRPIVWITGPAGSGKTTLIASYLKARKLPVLWYQLDQGDADPATLFHYLGLASRRASPHHRAPLPHATAQYLPGLAVFARRFFEQVFARLKTPTIVVFENHHDVPDSAPLHELLAIGLGVVPENIGVIVASRRAPHRTLGSLHAQRAIATVDEDALLLTPAELKHLAAIQLGARRLPSRSDLERLYRRTRGWAAGAVLLLERSAGSTDAGRRRPPQALFDYLAAEVFNRLDADTQTALLRTSVLPSMSVSTARALSGLEHAGDLLARLHRDRYFTERRPGAEPIYQYHPLFREFLLAQTERLFSVEALHALREAAARLAEDAGLVEDAGMLYRDAARLDELARLVLVHAARLLRDGRTAVVEQWLAALPAEFFEHTPWLTFWKATCRLPVNPVEAERDYTRAFEQFVAAGDRAGTLLAWCGVVDAIWYAWTELPAIDAWIDRFAALMPEGQAYPSPEIEAAVACAMFNALFWRRPEQAEVSQWARKATRVLESVPAFGAQHAVTAIALINFYVQVGELQPAEHIVEIMKDALRRAPASPIAETARYQGEAALATVLGDSERCRRAVAQGLEIAQRTGTLLWLVPLRGAGCLGSLSIGDLADAQAQLEQMLAHSADGALVFRSWTLTLQSRFAFLKGDLQRARRSAEASLRLTVREGPFPEVLSHLGMVQALHALGQRAEAHVHLARIREIARDMRGGMLEIGWRVAAAHIAYDEGRGHDGLDELRAAFAVGAATGIVEWQGDLRRQDLARLCTYALDAGVETQYVLELIRRRRLKPDPATASGAWPWPIKIYTLGRFAVLRDGRPVMFGRKAQKRPLDLLKVLVALGGRDVSQARVIEALWPDAEGDAAIPAMNMTLKRLRELLGDPAAVVLASRKITLDPGLCWVDAWGFERALAAPSAAAVDIDQLLKLYQGPFLGSDDEPWAHSLRERLHDKVLERVRQHGSRLEQRNQFAEAVLCYRGGLAVDDLSEELYQRVMLCHDRLGQRGEALAAYRRCKKSLSAHGGAAPSAKTERIYRQVLASSN